LVSLEDGAPRGCPVGPGVVWPDGEGRSRLRSENQICRPTANQRIHYAALVQEMASFAERKLIIAIESKTLAHIPVRTGQFVAHWNQQGVAVDIGAAVQRGRRIIQSMTIGIRCQEIQAIRGALFQSGLP
jgi:hypothetical protein